MLAANPFTATKFIKSGFGIESRSFDGHRVDVLRPSKLHPETPILIVHDGMNVFFKKYASSGETWQIREAVKSGAILGDPLVIAVWGEGGTKKYNPRRINEFLCDDIVDAHPELWQSLLPGLTPPTREPRGNYFMDLVSHEVLPEVCERFGIEHSPIRTALAGCSVAGVAAIYWLAKRPEVFGAAFALSAHWEFGGKTLIDELTALLGDAKSRKVWSDSGTEGLDAVSCGLNDYFAQQLFTKPGWELKRSLEAPTFWGTGHHETFWSHRVRFPINWWLESIPSGANS